MKAFEYSVAPLQFVEQVGDGQFVVRVADLALFGGLDLRAVAGLDLNLALVAVLLGALSDGLPERLFSVLGAGGRVPADVGRHAPAPDLVVEAAGRRKREISLDFRACDDLGLVALGVVGILLAHLLVGFHLLAAHRSLDHLPRRVADRFLRGQRDRLGQSTGLISDWLPPLAVGDEQAEVDRTGGEDRARVLRAADARKTMRGFCRAVSRAGAIR